MKKLFGSEENKDILISFINAVVSKENQVKEVILLNPYNRKEYPAGKLWSLDIKATDEQGKQYNIEMQIIDQVSYTQRALYYWSRLYTNQLQEGDAFGQLKKTISINILNFNCFEHEPNYHNIYKILNIDSHRIYTEDLELHYIELNKFDAEVMHIKTALDRWTTFLKKAYCYDQETLPQALKEVPAIGKAMDKLNILYFDKSEREVYEARLKWLRDEAGAIEKAMLKGREEGLQLGENKVKRTTARRMLAKGINIEVIAEITGLTIEAIENLK